MYTGRLAVGIIGDDVTLIICLTYSRVFKKAHVQSYYTISKDKI